ncbi:MAG: hypothetical protein JOZ62_07495, partial [Acidobacteriaceae bacterium]|nr:hypothetical protein [Acidobacteriaceae bacterium]
TQFISRSGPTSVGRDAAAIGGTTALGAAIGAAADWGRGAAIGTGAGAAVGILGVLVTRGEPSVIYPEQMITFRLETPVTVSTEHEPYAFRYVQPNEYDRPQYGAGPPPARPYYATTPVPPPAPYYYPYPYYAYAYPYYWGPTFGFYVGPRFYYRSWYGHPIYRGRVIAYHR